MQMYALYFKTTTQIHKKQYKNILSPLKLVLMNLNGLNKGYQDSL